MLGGLTTGGVPYGRPGGPSGFQTGGLPNAGGKPTPVGNPGWEPVLHSQIASAVQSVGPRETEWDPEKLKTKLLDYLWKAAKSVMGSSTWMSLVKEFSTKFFDSLFSGMGDRTWLEDVDLTLCVGVAIHAYCDPSVMAQVPSE